MAQSVSAVPRHHSSARPGAHPSATAAAPGLGDLSEGGHLFIWGVRHWMVALLCRTSVPLSVSRVFDLLGEPAAVSLLASFVLLAARDADRPLVVHPPCSGDLSADETALTLALAAGRDSRVARQRLGELVGCPPSASLIRSAVALATSFRAAGLEVGFPARFE